MPSFVEYQQTMAMNSSLLIDAIVRQTVILIASLATGAGQRPSLSHVADQVFAALSRELKQQGLSNKLIADMFGMALRTYQTRTSQLAESRSAQGQSLWQAVYDYVQRDGPLLRAAVLRRFARDDAMMVRAVLRDLVDSGVAYKSGRGDATTYRAREGSETRAPGEGRAALSRMLWVAIDRHGALTREALGELVSGEAPAAVDAALDELTKQGLVQRASAPEGESGAPHYSCERCAIPYGDEAGWEAAVFDHYQAMVSALVTKLRTGRRRAAADDRLGGSTFVFDLYEGHPMQSEILGCLEALRAHALSLRARLDAHELAHPAPVGAAPLRVIAYVGQSVVENESEVDTAGEGDDA